MRSIKLQARFDIHCFCPHYIVYLSDTGKTLLPQVENKLWHLKGEEKSELHFLYAQVSKLTKV